MLPGADLLKGGQIEWPNGCGECKFAFLSLYTSGRDMDFVPCHNGDNIGKMFMSVRMEVLASSF